MNDQVNVVKLDLEKKILAAIATELQARKISAEQAQNIAKLVLARLHPTLSLAEIHQVLPQLSSKFELLAEVLGPIEADFNQKTKEFIAQKVEDLIRTDKVAQLHQLVDSLATL